MYEIILPLLRDADLRAEPIALSEEQARAKLAKDVPLLRDQALALDLNAARELLIRLARALEKSHRGAKPIREAIEKNKIGIEALVASVFAEDREYVAARAQEFKLDAELLWTLAQNMVKPAFRAWARQQTPLTKEGRGVSGNGGWGDLANWDRADCLVCGALATLGELQGNDQLRHLRCGRCGADWQVRRIICVYCGNENPKNLNKLNAENQHQQAHAQVCNNCKSYIKVINAFSPNPPEMIAVQDLATLHLDFIAQKHGYTRTPAQKRQ